LRIRVNGRFDVVLRQPPEEDAAIYINEQDVRIISTRRKHRRTPNLGRELRQPGRLAMRNGACVAAGGSEGA